MVFENDQPLTAIVVLFTLWTNAFNRASYVGSLAIFCCIRWYTNGSQRLEEFHLLDYLGVTVSNMHLLCCMCTLHTHTYLFICLYYMYICIYICIYDVLFTELQFTRQWPTACQVARCKPRRSKLDRRRYLVPWTSSSLPFPLQLSPLPSPSLPCFFFLCLLLLLLLLSLSLPLSPSFKPILTLFVGVDSPTVAGKHLTRYAHQKKVGA